MTGATGPRIKEGSSALGRREKMVMALLGKGMENKDIADVLHISPKTVSTYMDRIKFKLDVGSTRELIVYILTHKDLVV